MNVMPPSTSVFFDPHLPSSTPINIISTSLSFFNIVSTSLPPLPPTPRSPVTPTIPVATPTTPVTPPITPITPITPVNPATPAIPVNLLASEPSLPTNGKDKYMKIHKEASNSEEIEFREISGEVLAEIFCNENRVRKALEKDSPLKEEDQQFYNQEILPFIQQAKLSIKQRPIHSAIKAAAAKGKAVQVGLKALKNLAQDDPWIRKNVNSAQSVCLLPQEGTVFKHLTEKAAEEERIVNSLFDLMSEKAVVGTFNIQKASLKRFGIQVPLDIKERGFTLDVLSPALRTGIKEKLPAKHLAILETHESKPAQDSPIKTYYQQMKSKKWNIQLPGKEKKKVDFKTLQKLNLADKLSPETIISSYPISLSFGDHIRLGTPLFQALNYFPTFEEPTVYLTPDLRIPDHKIAYELCEQFKWICIDQNDVQQEVDFKTLHAIFLKKETMKKMFPIWNGIDTIPSNDQFKIALNAPWKLFSSEIMHLTEINPDSNSSSYSATPVCNIQTKPFVEMLLLNDLDLETRDAALKRLTKHSQFNAILTSELQLLDLHAKNLGVKPKHNSAYSHYKNVQFTLLPSNETKNFKDLIIAYLKGQIQPDTVIKFKKKGREIVKQLKDLPKLQQALNVRWNLVIFDTDLSLSEDNWLQFQIRSGVKEHLIPLRSVLLETSWKDHPLSDAMIQYLMNSEEHDFRVEQWASKADAPIYKRLSASALAIIKQQMTPYIEKYSLSDSRNNNVTIKSLTNQFSDEVSDAAHPVWKIIEQDLSSAAQRYHENVATFKDLNLKVVQPRKKIKLQFDNLTSSNPEAKKKRKEMATQLFPRITSRQQRALLERQRNRKEYLRNYQNLSQSTLKGEELFTQIEQYVQASTTLFSSRRRAELLRELTSRKDEFLNQPQTLSDFKSTICTECQPSYFNLAKVMYPLLADAYELNQAVYSEGIGYSKAVPGQRIGLYDKPLQETIKRAKTQFAADSPEVRLAEHMERQITDISNPAFFGTWL